MSKTKTIYKILENMDFFRVPVNLLFQKKPRTSTISGKIMSYLIIAYFAYKIVMSPMLQK